MKAQRVLELIAQGEGETIEFKKAMGQLRRVVETTAALANTRGGHLFIGVREDGEVG